MSMAEKAKLFATLAHEGQVDKSGAPYIEHPARVAQAVQDHGDVAVAAAWLHDVVEDCSVSPADLRAAGFDQEVVDAVEVLTHRKNEPRVDYYARVKTNPVALIVKRADVKDNMSRLDNLDGDTRARLVVKYAKAKKILGPESGTREPW